VGSRRRGRTASRVRARAGRRLRGRGIDGDPRWREGVSHAAAGLVGGRERGQQGPVESGGSQARLEVAPLAWRPMAGRGVGNRPVRLSSTPRTRMGREGKSGVVVTVARRGCRADGFPSTTPMIQAWRGRRRDRGFPCCGMWEIVGDCAA